jgi:hypothetical protein
MAFTSHTGEHKAALIVAFIAARYQRPELATSRLKVLAFANT